MHSFLNFQTTKTQEKQNLDQTKETFIDKLRNYQAISGFKKTNQLNLPPKSKRNLFDPMSQKDGNHNFLSPRFGISTGRKHDKKPLPDRVEQSNYKPYGRSQPNQQTSYSFLSTKYKAQQKCFDTGYQSHANLLSDVQGKYNSYENQQGQSNCKNFIVLQSLQKSLIATQKNNFTKEPSLQTEKARELVLETVRSASQIIKSKHKNHLQTSIKAISLVQEQFQMIKKGLQNQSQLCEHNWCEQLDRINEDILRLNNLISQVRVEQMDRSTENQWKIKQLKFNCQEIIQKENQERTQKDFKLHCVLEKLIERVGTL